MELHVFDFDGTLFLSPTPNHNTVLSEYNSTVFGKLRAPFLSDGFGWFQSLSSLSPPAVPAKPAESEWYVMPVVNCFRSLVSRKVHPRDCALDKQNIYVNGTASLQMVSEESEEVHRLFFVLTGRCEEFRNRIEYLLDNIGLLEYIEHVFLKPQQGPGTVEYKLNTFLDLILKWEPHRVFYYEDRYDQGARILEGMRQLQNALFPARDNELHLCFVTDLIDVSTPKSSLSSGVLPVPDTPRVISFNSLPQSSRQADANREFAYSRSSKKTRQILTYEDLCGGSIVSQERVRRYINRWLVKTIHDHNKTYMQRASLTFPRTALGRGVGSGGLPAMGESKAIGLLEKNSHLSHASPPEIFSTKEKTSSDLFLEAIQFRCPPPFSFTLAIVSKEISTKSDTMLSPVAQSVLIETLMKEKEVWDGLKIQDRVS